MAGFKCQKNLLQIKPQPRAGGGTRSGPLEACGDRRLSQVLNTREQDENHFCHFVTSWHQVKPQFLELRKKVRVQPQEGLFTFSSVQFCSVAQLCPTLCDTMDYSRPGLPVHHHLPEFTQTLVHWVGDAIQPSHPLSSPSPPSLNLSQHQGLFKWVSSSNQVAKVLEFQLQHQSCQWTPRTDL